MNWRTPVGCVLLALVVLQLPSTLGELDTSTSYGLGNLAGVAGIALLAIWLIHSGRERARRRSRR